MEIDEIRREIKRYELSPAIEPQYGKPGYEWRLDPEVRDYLLRTGIYERIWEEDEV